MEVFGYRAVLGEITTHGWLPTPLMDTTDL